MKSRITCLAALLALPLFGCNDTQNIVVCPAAAILAETAGYAAMRPGAPNDPSGELYRVRLTNVATDCVFVKETSSTDSTLDLTFHASRAPSSQAAHYTLTYFVAATQASRILSKIPHSVSFDFPAGAQAVDFTDHVSSATIVMENGHTISDYQLTVGLQLTAAQREYNKTVGRYAP